jgi:hypothetical protein
VHPRLSQHRHHPHHQQHHQSSQSQLGAVMDALHLHDVPPLQQWRDQQREIQVCAW